MDLYIDKNNLVSFLRAGKNTNVDDRDVYEECQRLLRRNMHLIFNFEKRSCEKDEDLLPWLLSKVSAGRGKSENVDEFRTQKFPERPLKTNFRTNKDWKLFTSVFMLDDEKVSTLKDTHSMLIGDVGDEVALLRELFCTGSFDLHSIYNIRDKQTFPGWKRLLDDGHIMPCSDIVIADRYLFDVSNTVMDKNLYVLLRLFARMKDKQKVNIVFFTDVVEEEKRSIVKKNIETIFGKKSGTKVTFVMYKNERPHDRFILTNYRLFRSGDSFNNYFDENGNLNTKGLTLDVDSLANQNVISIVEEIRSWLQGICIRNPANIFGDKCSNFIHFNE